MSLFKSSWLILRFSSPKQEDLLFYVFTYDYGRIILKTKKKKKEKMLDSGFFINFEIHVKKNQDIHEMSNIKIKHEFPYLTQNYETLYEYLFILKIINEKAPLRTPIYEIFTLLEHINTSTPTPEKLIIAQLKILDIFWILEEQNHPPIIQKILYFIQNENIFTLWKLTGVTWEIKNELKKIIHKYMHNF